jgi:hypothetical protein
VVDSLGRDSYWPVALLDEYRSDPAQEPPIPSRLHAVKGEPANSNQRWKPPKPQGWLVLNGLVIVAIVLYIFLMRAGSVFSASQTSSICAPVYGETRNRLIALTAALLLAVVVLVTWPWGWWLQGFEPMLKWKARCVLVVVWALLAWILHRELKRRSASTSVRGWFAGTVTLLAAIPFAFWLLGDYYLAKINLPSFRYIHITSGVSPLPACLFVLGACLWWVWYSLVGTAALDDRRPKLPCAAEIPLRPFTEEWNSVILRLMSPAPKDFRIYLPALAFLTVLAFCAVGAVERSHPVWTLEAWPYDFFYAFVLMVVFLVTLTELARLVLLWIECRRLLRALDRTFLRRAFCRLEGFSWNPLWGLGGASFHDSYRLLSRELASLEYLKKDPEYLKENYDNDVFSAHVERVSKLMAELPRFVQAAMDDARGREKEDPVNNDRIIAKIGELQTDLASTCATVLKSLMEVWSQEKGPSLFDSADPASKAKDYDGLPSATLPREQFVALLFANFISNVFLRMRTVILTIAGLYIFLLLSISAYPVEPKPILRPALILMFFAIAGVVGTVYAQMHRDATLSRLTKTAPGELGLDFYVKTGSFLVLPLISLLVSQFPDINNLLFSWLTPAAQALNH